MIVVSDTSPISNLLTVGQVQVLPAIFQQVYIPQEVWQELAAFHAHLDPLKHASWLAVKTVTNQTLMQQLRQDLDAGESAAIALAIELSIPVILMDEKVGRRFARKYNLRTTGLLGVLLEAIAQGHLPAVKPIMDQLRQQARFFIAEPLYRQVCQLAGE